MSFQVGQKVRATARPPRSLLSAWERLTNDHGRGPYRVRGVHPKHEDGQLAYIETPRGSTMVDASILEAN